LINSIRHFLQALNLPKTEIDVATEAECGRRALDLAAENGHLDVVRLLVETGADVAAKDEWGRTALHCVAEQGHGDVVARLLDSMEGADVAAGDMWGMTALQRGAEHGHGDVVALLERALEKDSTSRIRGDANEDHQPCEVLL
jgi:ankyrin repeat protein